MERPSGKSWGRLLAIWVEGKLLTDKEEIKEQVQTYFMQLGKQEGVPNLSSLPREDDTLGKTFQQPFTEEEVENATKRRKAGKTVSPDDIPIEFISKGGPQLLPRGC